MTKIHYSKARLKINLRVAIVLISLGIILVSLSLIIGNWKNISLDAIGFGQIGGGLFMLLVYYFEKNKQYLSLNKGELIKNTLFPKKIKLKEIVSIKEFAGDLKLISAKNEFVIDTQIIETNSLLKLKGELENYNLK
ncbi:hypothetical protein [Psychroflexus aestuariivivens]|uniref:hypothetical protein n=1 Tax=Psychroflexus aestuariivivens TaxID=1795040 RepID=UPI000FD967BA|nr:hypothetical protein [Psychroflexus aestuariivivens]